MGSLVESQVTSLCKVLCFLSERGMSEKVIPPIHWALSVSHKPMLSLLLSPQEILKTLETGLVVLFIYFASFTDMGAEPQQKAGACPLMWSSR